MGMTGTNKNILDYLSKAKAEFKISSDLSTLPNFNSNLHQVVLN